MCKELGVESGRGYSAKTIVDLLEMVFSGEREPGESSNDYYCGVTQRDVRPNLSRHHIRRYLAAFICDDADIAAKAESMLHEEGFNTGDIAGGHGGDEDSVVVYMYKITPETRQ